MTEEKEGNDEKRDKKKEKIARNDPRKVKTKRMWGS